MKKSLVILMVFYSIYANAQSHLLLNYDTMVQNVTINTYHPDSLNIPDSIFSFNESGALIIPDNCDEYMLASVLNTSPDIATKILKVWNCTDSPTFSQVLASEKTLSGIARVIYKHLDNEFSKSLFLNYWTGGGDIELSDRQFADILICINTKKNEIEWLSDSLLSLSQNKPCQFSFYNTKYCKAFGIATIYINSENCIVGFSDTYDFDAKKWGIRPLKYELYVRLVSLLSPPTASKFKIRY